MRDAPPTESGPGWGRWIWNPIDSIWFWAQDPGSEIPGVGPDAPTVFNEQGAGQSHLPYRFDLFDGPSMFKMAEVLHEGAEKYGANNWRGISLDDHLNHMIAHAYAYLSGDRSDDHLSHCLCRAMFAQGTELQGGPTQQPPPMPGSEDLPR